MTSDNLKSWEPGQSGNPAGRPIGSRNRSTIVREWLELKNGDETNLDKVMKALINKASSEDVPAIREVLDSAFGKNPDKQELTGKDGGPIETALPENDRAILDHYMKTKLENKDA